MFTGIIENTGKVVGVREVPGGRRLTVDVGPLADDARDGASIAVDGVCLTVCGINGALIDFDVIAETLGRATLGQFRVNDTVNLERSLRAGDRIDGHFVQGHVDGIAELTHRQVSPREWVLRFKTAPDVMRYIVPKGSVAISGVSLTVASVERTEFTVALIPTTLSRTTLQDLSVGDRVNIETDVLVRTIVHTMQGVTDGGTASGGISESTLQEHGFL